MCYDVVFSSQYIVYGDTAFVIVVLLWCCDYSLLQNKHTNMFAGFHVYCVQLNSL